MKCDDCHQERPDSCPICPMACPRCQGTGKETVHFEGYGKVEVPCTLCQEDEYE